MRHESSDADADADAAPTTRNASFFRKLLVTLVFLLTNILAWRLSNGGQDSQYFPTMAGTWMSLQSEDMTLTSGVGLVTTDGAWPEESADSKYKEEDIVILGFTDSNYVPIAKAWYTRMSLLGYTEHWIVAHDEAAYNILRASDFRVFPCFIKNPDLDHLVTGLWKQIMSSRLHFTQELLRNGTHVLITDVDNIFSRHVPLYGFLEEGYDAYHAFEMRYPTDIYDKFGFVICSGLQFLRSSPETLRFMDLVMKRCSGAKCDDQVVYNQVLFYDLNVKWDNIENPHHDGALRVNTTHTENRNLLVESVTGRSVTTNHTIKIWDRDFAWRLAGGGKPGEPSSIPDFCPSSNNWLGMPTKLETSLIGWGNKIFTKIKSFEVWDNQCRHTELLGLTPGHLIRPLLHEERYEKANAN